MTTIERGIQSNIIYPSCMTAMPGDQVNFLINICQFEETDNAWALLPDFKTKDE